MTEFADFKRFGVLGRGATATVYKAQNTKTNEWCALKVFHPNLLGLDSEIQQQRIRNEFRVSSKLSHPSIVAINELLIEDEQAAIVMPLVEGQSLEIFQSRLPYVLPEISVLLVLEILKALEYAHAQKVIHRDLKPSNILISHSGEVFVVDFGLARWEEGTCLTTTGSILGSPDFMSPEQAQGMSANYSSDLFCISAILYFLVTGTRPFSRPTPLATLAAVVKGDFEVPHKRNPKLNLQLSELISKGLSKDGSQRFASATEFRNSLEAYLSDIGLSSEFTFQAWTKNPQDFVYQGLSLIAEQLTIQSHKHMSQGHWQKAALCISHLALVAPESHSILKLGLALDKSRRKKSFLRLTKPALLALLLMLVATGGLMFYRSQNTQISTAVAALEPVAATTPTATPEFKIDEPKKVIEAAPITRVLVPRKPSADVFFDVNSQIEVYWNGQRMVSGQRLKKQTYGTYRLRLVRPGFAPILQNIEIKTPETINIRAR